jgi:predicted N-acetyltransferase YhbS
MIHFREFSLTSTLDLAGLAVDPDHQRKGLAGKLIRTVLVKADQDGLPTYLEATPDGAPVYPRFGFEQKDEFECFDMRFLGMVRPPQLLN